MTAKGKSGAFDFLAKIRNWQQVIAVIIIIPITLLRPEPAIYSVIIIILLIGLAFYIVKKSFGKSESVKYLEGNLDGHKSLMDQIEKELTATNDKTTCGHLAYMHKYVDLRTQMLNSVYTKMAK